MVVVLLVVVLMVVVLMVANGQVKVGKQNAEPNKTCSKLI